MPKRRSERRTSDEVLAAFVDKLAATVAQLVPPRAPSINVTDLWDLFRQHAEPRLRSWPDYVQRWRDHVGPAFGARDAAGVVAGDVDTYRADRRAAGAALATVNREVALLRRLLNFGVRRGKLPRSQLHGPGMTAELIQPENSVRTTVIEEDPAAGLTLEQLMAAADVRLRAMILLLHHTGLRRAEAARLRWDRIRDGAAWLPGAETKGGYGGHAVPLSSLLLAELEHLDRYQDSPWVFPSRYKSVKGASPVHPDYWTRAFGKLVRRIGLKGPDGGPPWPHDLRRSFVTLSRRDGENEEGIMNISGHKTRSVFSRYDAYDPKDVLQFRERREARRAGASQPTAASITGQADQ